MIKTKSFITAALIAVLIVCGYSYYSPQIHLRQLRSAAEAKDTERLRELIDFDSVRAGLKDDMRTMVTASMQRELSGNPFAALGMMMLNAMVDPMVDAMVSPASIVAMVEHGKVEATANVAKQESTQPYPRSKPATGVSTSSSMSDVLVEQGYQTYTRYRISIRPADEPPPNSVSFDLRRDGLFNWKLSRIVLPAMLFERK